MRQGVGDRVTVVTVTYNAEDYLENTILSIINQSYQNIEYIVVDGSSTDGTLDIVKKYGDEIDTWISEEDSGIYDAMNKAIDLANGEWIIFMNAGDSFYNDDVIQDVFEGVPEDVELVYGHHAWKHKGRISTIYTRPLDVMWQHISFSHQSLFSRTSLMKKKKFDLSYKIVSDYEFYFSQYMQGRCFFNSDVIISAVSGGGLSDVSFVRRTYERWTVVKKYKKGLVVHKYYFKLLYRHLVVARVSKLLGFFSR